ncbi:hypothetical protein DZB84_12530 [Bacillus sp. HNG]|uniref:hypothetical protein n=1 Tax=Bacillus sp. HNG TaxID=2293325 RepID=UPI000E2F1336|nr:hypothetical protein [Bacillus sp. HNG]RFB15233.1 hypothetical protein DZB84_12530 [Bacillus sp. HNG]
MLIDFLLIEPEVYTQMALNVSVCIGLMLLLLSTQRVHIGFSSPLSNFTDTKISECKKFDGNRSLLIQYFITRRITKSIRNKRYTSDDSESFVSFYLNSSI